MLKAIETRYKGYRFRSRLEARWAVFFDTLRIPWLYEAEGYDLDGLWYLPDFQMVADLWIEIKSGTPNLEEIDKARQLAIFSKGIVIIAGGTPGEEKIWFINDSDIITPETTNGYPVWCDLFQLCRPTICHAGCKKTIAAYTAARSARFEHGEHP